MAGIESEEMRQLLRQLGEQLSQTKGDETIVAQLRAVEKALNKLNARESSNEKRSRTETKRLNDELIKDLVKELDESKALKDIKDAVKDSASTAGPNQGKLSDALDPKKAEGFTKGIGKGILSLGKFSGDMLNTTAKMVTNFGNLDGSVTGLAKATGLTSGAVLAVTEYMDQNISAYRLMASTNEGTIGSILELQRAAQKSSLGVTEFAEAIAKGTQGTRLMGAQPWGELYNSIKTQSKSIGYYAMDTKTLLAKQDEYLQMQVVQGNLLGRSNEDLASGFDALIKSTDQSAHILGLTRDEYLKEKAAANADPNFNRARQTFGLDTEANETLGALVTNMSKLGPELKRAFQEQVQFGSTVTSESAQMIAQLPPEAYQAFKQLAADARAGKISTDQADNRFAEFTDGFKTMTEEQKKFLADQGAISGGIFEAINQTAINVDNIKEPVDDAKSKLASSDAPKDPTTVAMLQLDQIAHDFSSAVQAGITNVWEPFATTYGKEILGMTETAGQWVIAFKGMIEGLTGFSGAISLITGALAGGGLVSAISGLTTGILVAKFAPIMRGIGTAIATPISMLAKSVGGLGDFFAKGGFTTLLAKAGFALGGANFADSIMGDLGYGKHNLDEDLNGKGLTKNKLDQKNWDDMSWWQAGLSSVVRGTEQAASLVGMDTLANEVKNTRIMAETLMIQDADKKEETPKDVDPQTTNTVEPKTKEEIHNQILADMGVKPEEKTEEVKPKEQLEAKSPEEEELRKFTDQQTKLLETMGIAKEEITKAIADDPTLKADRPKETDFKLDNPAIMEAFNMEALTTSMDTQNEALRAQLASQNTLLQAILKALNDGNNFDRENGALIRDKLNTIKDTNGDLLRAQKK